MCERCHSVALHPLHLLKPYLGGMSGVRGAVGELFQEDGLWELGARLKGRPKVEVQADVGMIAVLNSTHLSVAITQRPDPRMRKEACTSQST